MKWKSLFCLPVLALLLLACGGCQPKSAILLQGKELASWEDLYGQDIDAVAGALGVGALLRGNAEYPGLAGASPI